MNKLFLLLLCLLVGCRQFTPVTPPPTPVPVPPLPVTVSAASVPMPTRPVTAVSEPRSRQQAQIIEALLSQNDALTAQLATLQTTAETKAVAAAPEPATVIVASPVHPVAPEVENVLVPNADGAIDLAGPERSAPADEPVNPFTVRMTAADQTHEVTLKVGGIVLGAAPSALINDRLVQAGDRIEAFTVERIESDAVLVRANAHLLRLPVSTVPARVRLPL